MYRDKRLGVSGKTRRKMKKKRERKGRKSSLSPGNLCASHLVSLIKLGVRIQRKPLAQRGSRAPSHNIKEPADHTVPDLLSLYTIDNGVEHWWHHHIKIG